MISSKLLLVVILCACLQFQGIVGAWTIFRRTRLRERFVTFPADGPAHKGRDEATIHRHFMKLAIKEARNAAKRNEVPIGAIVVKNITQETDKDTLPHQYIFQILSTGRNQVEGKWDASAHAELLALRQAARRIQNWRLINCTLYSTLEPCPMCLSACQAFRVSRLVYGAPDLRLGAVETHMKLLDIVHPFHNVSVVQTGVLEEDCADMLRSFFRARRLQSNESLNGPNNRLSKWFRRVWLCIQNN